MSTLTTAEIKDLRILIDRKMLSQRTFDIALADKDKAAVALENWYCEHEQPQAEITHRDNNRER